jgi:hypothetical protein
MASTSLLSIPAKSAFLAVSLPRDAAHFHLLTNHIPIFVTLSGLLILAWTLIRKERRLVQPALMLLLLGALGGMITYWLGEQAYRPIRSLADEVGQDWLDVHMERADQIIWIFWLSLASTVAAMIAAWKSFKFSGALCLIAGALAAGSLAAAGWAADAGGQIRHSEVRSSPPPVDTEFTPHEH